MVPNRKYLLEKGKHLNKATYQIVQLDCSDALVHTRNDLLCNRCSVNMFSIQSIAEPRDTSSDLVELYALLAVVYIE